MSFGVYVHIPYCLQRCIYCDFATYETSQILPPNEYVDRVKREIALRSQEIGPKKLDTLYFGGGTPSLLDAPLLISIVHELGENGFSISPSTEVTLEINPATLDPKKIDQLIKAGFNRFSVGAQTFDDSLLQKCHRKHSAQDTRDTLNLLRDYNVNFSLDILFALPTQTIGGLKRDLDEALTFDPPHVSPYFLTVPESNPLSKGRAPEEDQAQMFSVIEEALTKGGLERYEISNFAKPGDESRHNMLYWEDQSYWGIGLSSHSYLNDRGDFGTRFWNAKNINEYVGQIDGAATTRPFKLNMTDSFSGEILEKHQALTDFFHIQLRLKKGLSYSQFQSKFGVLPEDLAKAQIQRLLDQKLINKDPQGIRLTPKGLLLSNKVFEELTFLPKDLPTAVDKKHH